MSPSEANAAAIAASQQWARRMLSRSRSLAPWDEMAWFDTPVEASLALNPGAMLPIALSNPRRVAIVFAYASGTAVHITTFTSTSPAQGIRLTAQTGPFIVLQRELGSLCQVQWNGWGEAPGDVVTVQQVLLRDWPNQ